MVNLKALYGNRIFDRKVAHRNTRRLPLLAGFCLDIVIAPTLVWIFDIKWDYANVKVYGILVILGILKYMFSSSIDHLNYRFFVKDAIASEMKHYLGVFNGGINWHEIGTYDDFLLQASFSKTLPADLRVLAAINYGVIAGTMHISPQFENRCYRLFSQITPDFIPKDVRKDCG